MNIITKYLIAIVILIASAVVANAETLRVDNVYTSAGIMLGASNLDEYDSRANFGVGVSVGGNWHNINIEGNITAGTLHLQNYIPTQDICNYAYSLLGGYTFKLSNRWTLTPQMGCRWHAGGQWHENPYFISGVRVHYSFNSHWGIANSIETDFTQSLSERIHIVYTF